MYAIFKTGWMWWDKCFSFRVKKKLVLYAAFKVKCSPKVLVWIVCEKCGCEVFVATIF